VLHALTRGTALWVRVHDELVQRDALTLAQAPGRPTMTMTTTSVGERAEVPMHLGVVGPGLLFAGHRDPYHVMIYYPLMAMERITSAGGKLRGVTLILALVVVAWRSPAPQLHVTWLLQAVPASVPWSYGGVPARTRRLFTAWAAFSPTRALERVTPGSSRNLGESIAIWPALRWWHLSATIDSTTTWSRARIDCEISAKLVTSDLLERCIRHCTMVR
jgi:hypothetical protein